MPERTARAHEPVAVVTGGTRGLGVEICRQLAAAGWTVVLGARDPERGRAAATELVAEGLSVLPLQLDVTDAASVERFAADLAAEAPVLDVLINNAGIMWDEHATAAAADLATVREAMETNLFGAWRMIEALLPLLRAGEHGRIVNVSSTLAGELDMGPGAPAYRVSKGALNTLTRVLAHELHDEGIAVHAVCPGWLATDMGGAGGGPVAPGAADVVWAACASHAARAGRFLRAGGTTPW